ncbi:MAG: hypothetical protein JWN86_3744 [Planctomycetota bacterium]|nr:hypothetical protein [Planctomycetota bacterium]
MIPYVLRSPKVGSFLLGMAAVIAAPITAFSWQDTPKAEAKKEEPRKDEAKKEEPKKDAPKDEPKKEEPRPDAAPAPTTLSADWVKGLAWRPIGPANMGGRIVAMSVFEADPSTFWVATGGGGLLKTENNGTTFEHQFDKENTVAIGDVCVAPSDKNIVWVGTGENNPRNSVSFGDGVYKSTDGGKTWKNMGLGQTYQIGKILIHPRDPNIVYVGALGRLYGPSLDRGLYKTTDGGLTWNRVLYVDFRTGVIDMRMHPADPETLLIATYERKRDEFDVNEPATRWGPGSGIYKTNNGGKSFARVSKGLPPCQLGRIGLDWYKKDPNTVFAIVESEKNGMGPPTKTSGGGFIGITGGNREDATLSAVVDEGPAHRAGIRRGDMVVAIGDKEVKKYEDLTAAIRDKKPDDKVKLKVRRGEETREFEVTLGKRPLDPEAMTLDVTRPFAGQLNSQRENVMASQGPDGWQTGGVYKSTDAGETWTRINSVNPRPMYFSQIRVDPSDDQHLYVLGISQYHSKDGGKTFRPDMGRDVHADGHALWIDPRDGRHLLIGCDGGTYASYDRGEKFDHLNHAAIGQFYHVALDTRRDYKAYGGLQDNGTWGGPSFTRSRTGPLNEDWVSVGGGDGFGCCVDPNDPDLIYFTSQGGAMGRRNFRSGETASIRPRSPGRDKPMRFNWNTPFILSQHNSKIFYCGGNYLFRSLDRGNDLKAISPELTRTARGSATAISESPRDPNVLYVGTDDGNLWVTRDGGANWAEIARNVKLPGPRYVDTIEASRFVPGRVYVAFDGHRADDDDPLPYVSEDFGQTWKPLAANLPRGSTRCLREDLFNPDVLYLGTEFSCWATIDRGKTWAKINANLPTVAIHELAQHPTAGEIVAATHGRSLWVLDVSPLRQTTPKALAEAAHLYKPNSAVRWKVSPTHGGTNRRFAGQNPLPGARIDYVLGKKAEKVNLKVLDFDGSTIRELRSGPEPGLHRAVWDLTTRRSAPPSDTPGETARGAQESESGGGIFGGFGGGGGLRPVPPGTYKIVLTVDGKEFVQSVRVDPDPNIPPGEFVAAEAFLMQDEANEEEEEEERERGRSID